MGQDEGQGRTTVSEESQPQDPEQLRTEIEETREDLGETVAALASKTDVKSRAREKVTDVKSRVSGKKDEVAGKVTEAAPDSPGQAGEAVKRNPVPVAVIGALTAGLIVGILIRRRRS
jgi:ElaB/YqjD/DUF883 family membrane-anchored ribosome-binding protein